MKTNRKGISVAAWWECNFTSRGRALSAPTLKGPATIDAQPKACYCLKCGLQCWLIDGKLPPHPKLNQEPCPARPDEFRQMGRVA